jgi:hypothetical protein
MLRRVLAVLPRLAAIATVAVVGFAACASPTLPLPPPLEPTVAAGADANHFKLTAGCGAAESGALIVIENADTSIANDLRVSGSLTSGCGAWDATVYAKQGDVLNITQSDGTNVSPPVVVQIPSQ